MTLGAVVLDEAVDGAAWYGAVAEIERLATLAPGGRARLAAFEAAAIGAERAGYVTVREHRAEGRLRLSLHPGPRTLEFLDELRRLAGADSTAEGSGGGVDAAHRG